MIFKHFQANKFRVILTQVGAVMIRVGVTFMVALWASTALAQQWTEQLFSERSHDFGAVPRAARVEYEFKIKNPLKEDLHIISVRSSCGCTQPRAAKETLKPGEEGAIIAAFNTHAFTGQRSATVTVTFDRPQYTEVRLDVRGYIRTDIVLNPGQANLGSVAQGTEAEKKVRIEYAGRGDWKITGVTGNSPYISADIKELSRSAGRVSYELDVKLRDGAPVGYVFDQLQLATNDRRAAQFPVIVEGRIVAELSVSPTPLVLGTLQPGQTVTKQLVVKGIKPFKILELRCDNESFRFQPSDESKTLHLVPVTYEAADQVGKISQKIEIITDLPDNKSVELTAIGQVGAPLAGK